MYEYEIKSKNAIQQKLPTIGDVFWVDRDVVARRLMRFEDMELLDSFLLYKEFLQESGKRPPNWVVQVDKDMKGLQAVLMWGCHD